MFDFLITWGLSAFLAGSTMMAAAIVLRVFGIV